MSRLITILATAIALLAWMTRIAAAADPWTGVPYGMIPLPPVSEPSFELGGRYWWSEGNTHFAINSSKLSPNLGNPTSTLNYDNLIGNAGELTWRARNETDTFAKGLVGAGGLSGGTLTDRDFFAGQVKFSDTTSAVNGNNLIYGTIDVGQSFKLIEAATKLSFNPFVGFNYWQETAEARGARCNPDQVGGLYCPAGEMVIPATAKAITNQANWASIRLGAETRLKLWDRLTLIGDAAVLPLAYLWNEDSHHQRKDLGLSPNVEYQGSGWGYQLEGELRYDVTPAWSLDTGVRYWFAETNGSAKFVHHHQQSRLTEFESERFGVFGGATYRFTTF